MYGIGAGSAADLMNVELCDTGIAAVADGDKIVVKKSTLPVRTAQSLFRVLDANSGGNKFQILSNGNFSRRELPSRISSVADRLLIGSEGTAVTCAALRTLVDIYAAGAMASVQRTRSSRHSAARTTRRRAGG